MTPCASQALTEKQWTRYGGKARRRTTWFFARVSLRSDVKKTSPVARPEAAARGLLAPRLGRCSGGKREPVASPSYRLLLLTDVSVCRAGGDFLAHDLWARDLERMCQAARELCLVTPEARTPIPNARRLPPRVRVVLFHELTRNRIDELVAGHDVVQVGTGRPGWRSALYRRFARSARASGRVLVVTISSNRARTTLLNAQGTAWPRRVAAGLTASSIRRTQRYLAAMADGVILTGHGLTHLLTGLTDLNTHIEIASWITRCDIVADSVWRQKAQALLESRALEVCVATRLEPMKGAHLALEALRVLGGPRLRVLGDGEERPRLEAMARRWGLADRVQFAGTYAYPQPFLEEISRHHLVLLTNLNDEQPRLLFDAISQGVVPICPDAAPYRELGIDRRLLYRRGDPRALAEVVRRAREPALLMDVMPSLRRLAHRHTLESMHGERARWIARMLPAATSS